jgi:hypothetical protein
MTATPPFEIPDRIEPGRKPGGVVIVVYRWTDGAVLTESLLDNLADVEAIAETDAEAAFATPAVVLVGYDGDSGRALLPPMLVTDDPALLQS